MEQESYKSQNRPYKYNQIFRDFVLISLEAYEDPIIQNNLTNQCHVNVRGQNKKK